MAISIDVLMNAAQFLRGAKDVDAAFESVAEHLDDVARDSARAADAMGDDFKDASREVENSNERVEKTFKELADTAKRESKVAGDALGGNVRRGAKEAESGLDEFKSESQSTAKESAASFDGSASSIIDAFQEVAANAFIGFGPAGLAAGLVAAAGIGLAGAGIDQAGAKTEQFRARVSELTDELIEFEDTADASLEFIIDRLKAMATATDGSTENLSELRKEADLTETPFDKLAQSVAGASEETERLLDAGKRHLADLEDQAMAIDTTTNAGVKRIKSIEDEIRAQARVNDKLTTAHAEQTKAAQEREDYIASGAQALEDAVVKEEEALERSEAATKTVAAARQAALDQVNTAYDAAAGAVDGFIDAETGVFDTAGFIAAFQQKEAAIVNYKNTLASSPLSAEAKAFLQSQGLDAAAAFLTGYQAATPAQRDELNRIWTESGKQNSGTYSTVLKDGLTTAFSGVTIPGPIVDAKVVVDRRELDAVVKKSYTVVLDAVTRFGKPNP